MKKSILLSLILFILAFNSFQAILLSPVITSNGIQIKNNNQYSQPKSAASLIWNESRGLSGKSDFGRGIAFDSENNVYVAGYNQHDEFAYLLKYNSNGGLIKEKVWSANGFARGYDVAIDSNDRICVAGPIKRGAKFNLSIIQFDSDLDEIWNKTWDVKGSKGCGITIDLETDDIYIATLNRTTDWEYETFLLKFNSTGDIKLEKSFLKWGVWGVATPNLYPKPDVALDSMKNIYVVSVNYTDLGLGQSDDDLIIVKYNKTGKHLWNRTWDSLSDDEMGFGVDVDSDDNVYVVGTNGDTVLIKYNSTGGLQWNKSWNGCNKNDILYSIALDSNNDIYVVGSTQKPSNTYDVLLLKYDSGGNLDWSKMWGGSGHEHGLNLCLNKDRKELLITGSTISYSADNFEDILIMKYDISEPTIPLPSADDDDDDDDEELALGIVVLVVVLASIGAGVAVVVILIKKGK